MPANTERGAFEPAVPAEDRSSIMPLVGPGGPRWHRRTVASLRRHNNETREEGEK